MKHKFYVLYEIIYNNNAYIKFENCQIIKFNILTMLAVNQEIMLPVCP